MQQATWQDRITAIVEEVLTESPHHFWLYVERGTREREDCWRYAIPLAFYVLGHGKSPAEIAFFLTHGRWPEGLASSCRDELCVNPDHLVEVSADAELARRRHRRRRLTDDEIAELRRIRETKKTPYYKLADVFDADADNLEAANWGYGQYEGTR